MSLVCSRTSVALLAAWYRNVLSVKANSLDKRTPGLPRSERRGGAESPVNPMTWFTRTSDVFVAQVGNHLPFDGAFMDAEIEYVLGRFLPEQLEDSLTCERVGRGNSPRVDASMRVRILNDVLHPHSDRKRLEGLTDWTDLQVGMATRAPDVRYDVIIADKTQDFTANQIRGIENNCANCCSVTFILDTAQRIYSRGFVWRDVGLTITTANSHRPENNYRYTKQIAALAPNNQINLWR